MLEKNIIIDLDKTIGYFDQFSYICNYIEEHKLKTEHDVEYIHDNMLISLKYILRPKIIEILNTILHFKNNNFIKSFILYTNNQNKYLITKVIKLLKLKLNTNNAIFDYVIITKNKTKSYEDIKNNTNIILNMENKTKQLCVIDDKKHDDLLVDNVFYINCEPYVYEYNIDEIFNELKKFYNINKNDFIKCYKKKYKKYKKKKLSIINHSEISKKILYYINIFINHITF